jgi:hypothetical protein
LAAVRFLLRRRRFRRISRQPSYDFLLVGVIAMAKGKQSGRLGSSNARHGRFPDEQLRLFPDLEHKLPGFFEPPTDSAQLPLFPANPGRPRECWPVISAEREQLVRRVVKKVAGEQLSLFHAFPYVGREDLETEGLIAVMRAMSRYDFRRAALSSFAYMVANRQLQSFYKACRRQAGRDALAARGRTRAMI